MYFCAGFPAGTGSRQEKRHPGDPATGHTGHKAAAGTQGQPPESRDSRKGTKRQDRIQGRTEYKNEEILNNQNLTGMKKFMMSVAGLVLGTGLALAQETSYSELIISEYVEGSSNNKAIEIYNGTGADVDLSAYTLQKQRNGAGEFVDKAELKGTLANGEVYIVVNNQANEELLAMADLTSGSMNFNGNDAVGLFKNGTLIDIVGNEGDPAIWGEDCTLRRKCGFGPSTTYNATDWEELDIDDYSGLGEHCLPDNEAPAIDYLVTTQLDLVSVEIHFDEIVEAVSAGTAANYTLDNGVTVNAAVLGEDSKTVTLTTSEMEPGKQYTLTINRVEDIYGNATDNLAHTFYFAYVEVADIAELLQLRESYVDAQKYRITGELVITHRNGVNIYVQDKDCETTEGHSFVLYDKAETAIDGEASVGDVVQGATGSLTIYNDLFEMQFLDSASVKPTGEKVEPVISTAAIGDVLGNNLYHSALVRFENVNFVESEETTFQASKTYQIEDADNTIDFYTQTDKTADFIGMEIPEGKGTIIGFITIYKGNNQISPRSAADIFPKENAVEGVQAVRFSAYPNPTAGQLNLNVEADRYDVRVYGISGMEVMSLKALSGQAALDMSKLAKGVYVLEIQTAEGVSRTKVVLK